ncbi:hypothetical protein CDL15_Pgr021252 [Punica granatum]|uniref:Ubiquitin-like domain-containing protein n=1 Tax=Punica granatum TaxID=22663 RepID=A0A218WRP6_PUNGR|nr:hypothetical protein CDL15_Pgr021252 [Punica granatum]PKI68355.1 hypothetical protein CRG98_011263 [Punica granatum]
MMIKLRSKKSSKSSSKLGNGANGNGGSSLKGSSSMDKGCYNNGVMGEIKWELRPGGMLVQKRESQKSGEGMITVRVSYGTQWHDIPIEATSTFGELKMILSLLTSLEPAGQRLLFRGKEREDTEHLHMIGVGDRDKVLLLEDPAIKERKRLLHTLSGSSQPTGAPFRTISV